MLQKIRQVEKVFREIDADVKRIKSVTGTGCPSGCISCCLKPNLEASVLEFLPLAYHLVSTGQDEEVVEKIENGQTICVSLNTMRVDDKQPGCGFYSHRGAICRLFGSAPLRDPKTGKLGLYACKILKENYAAEWGDINAKISAMPKQPVVSDYYYRLMAIDPHLANDYNPINLSILKAIHKVSLSVRNRPQPNAPFGKAV